MARQNLSGAQNGTLQGAHGGVQQLGAAARARLAPKSPNTAGGGLNPTPPTMDPAQKPPPWQALQQAGIGGQGSAAANRAAAAGLPPQVKPMPLPGFQPMPGRSDGGLQIMDGAPGTVAFPGGGGQGIGADPNQEMTGGAPPVVDLPGRPGMFGSGAMQGVGNAVDQMQQHGGAPGGGGPLPGFTAAPGSINASPQGSMPGPSGKFPPRPGLPTKPYPMQPPGTPQVRPGVGGGIGPTGPRPRNNMASY